MFPSDSVFFDQLCFFDPRYRDQAFRMVLIVPVCDEGG